MVGETGQTPGQTSQTSGQAPTVPPPGQVPNVQTNVPTTKPWNMYVVLAAIVLVSAGTIWVLISYKTVFQSATDVTTVLSSWFTVVGTLCGAFFGIKATSDVNAQAQSTIQTSSGQAQSTIQATTHTTNQAVGALRPDVAAALLQQSTPQGQSTPQ